LVVVGGAGKLTDDEMTRLRPLFVEVLAPLAEALGACVADGGTYSGVMHLMGQARTETQASFPLVGVAATGTVALPDTPLPRPDATPLEPNHTHFVLVPGSEWGDDSPWLPRVVSVLAKGAPSVTVVINGGENTWKDVSESVEAGRRVIAVAGSGRAADMLVGALRGETVDERGKELVASGLVQAVDVAANPGRLSEMVKQTLSARG